MDVETANEIEQVLQRLNSWSANDKLTLVQKSAGDVEGFHCPDWSIARGLGAVPCLS